MDNLPRRKARALTTLFTVAATRIVLDEEYSYDNEGGETPLARELTQFLSGGPWGGTATGGYARCCARVTRCGWRRFESSNCERVTRGKILISNACG